MRILISLSYYAPNISGLTNSARILAEELSRSGYGVTIMASQHEGNLLPQENKSGIKIIRVPITFKIGKGPIMLRLPFEARKYVKQADVVNCHLPQFESFILAFLAKVNHKKLILTYQTDLSWSGGILLKMSKIFLLISHYLSARLADTIIASSKDYADNSWFLNLFKRKLIYINPPIKLTEPDKIRVKMFAEKMHFKRKYIIGVVSRLSPEKGIEYLLESIPDLISKLGDSFIIVIVGPSNPIGESSYIHKIETLFEKYSRFVKYIGKLADEDLTCFYKTLDVLVLPSVNSTEAFGMVQVEAMLCGIPIVASNLPGIRVPIVATGMGELVESRNSQNLAKKIVRILKDKSRYIKKKEFIESKFSLNHTISEYEKLFKYVY